MRSRSVLNIAWLLCPSRPSIPSLCPVQAAAAGRDALRLEFTMPDGCSPRLARRMQPVPPPPATRRTAPHHSPAQVPVRRARALRRQGEPPAQGAGGCTLRHSLCCRCCCRRRQRSGVLQPRAMRSILVGANAITLFISSSARHYCQSRRGIMPRAPPRRPCRCSAARRQRRQRRGCAAGPVEAGAGDSRPVHGLLPFHSL